MLLKEKHKHQPSYRTLIYNDEFSTSCARAKAAQSFWVQATSIELGLTACETEPIPNSVLVAKRLRLDRQET